MREGGGGRRNEGGGGMVNEEEGGRVWKGEGGLKGEGGGTWKAGDGGWRVGAEEVATPVSFVTNHVVGDGRLSGCLVMP